MIMNRHRTAEAVKCTAVQILRRSNQLSYVPVNKMRKNFFATYRAICLIFVTVIMYPGQQKTLLITIVNDAPRIETS